MKRRKIETLVIGLAVLSLAAGVAAGFVASRVSAASASLPSPADSTPLTVELQLTPDQRDQMRDIWETVRSSVRNVFDDAQRLEKQRDDAMIALLNDEQKARFEKLSQTYADRFNQLTQKRDQTFQDAVERTRKLLTEEQRVKYEAILKAHLPAGAEPAFGPPTSQPIK
ncbi:MAG TPA: Spy/CpxP family protein refolding chaperone [Tepidisphaeraceae bacterium]|nr:Spy/CpxP family protein refolding chaperone [Tepidisphaeraceae bacterium]